MQPQVEITSGLKAPQQTKLPWVHPSFNILWRFSVGMSGRWIPGGGITLSESMCISPVTTSPVVPDVKQRHPPRLPAFPRTGGFCKGMAKGDQKF